MNPLYITDICTSVFESLDRMNHIIRLELLSMFHMKIIRNHNWNKYIFIRTNSMMIHIINNYKFRNLDIGSCVDINMYVDKLKNCHTLDLSHTNISDTSIIELKNCHTLDLSYTDIANGISKLGTCHTLNLCHTNVTDIDVGKLNTCHKLDLSYTNTTDASISKLGNCRILILYKTKVTDECVSRLRLGGCIVYV